jgi:hypothetical protein
MICKYPLFAPDYGSLPYEYTALSDIIRVGTRSSFMHSVTQINTRLTKKLQRNLKYEWKNSRNSTPNSHFNLTLHGSYYMHHHVNIKLPAFGPHIVFVFRMIVRINRNVFLNSINL